MNVIEILQKLSLMGKKKDARKIIYSIEESARTSGLSNVDVLRHVCNELKRNTFIGAIIKILSKPKQTFETGITLYLKNAISLLTKGKPRSVAYKDILRPDIIRVLKAAENRGLTGSDIFKNYSKMEAIVARAEAKLRNILIGPSVTYVLASILAYVTINTLYASLSTGPKINITGIRVIKDYFMFLTIAPFALTYYTIIKWPQKVPKWKTVYKHVKSTNYLLVTKTMFDNGMSSMDVLSFLQKLNDKSLKLDDLENKNDMNALATALSYYMSEVEIALLKASVQATEQKRVISNIAEDRITEIDETVKTVTEAFGKMLTLISMWPGGLALYALVRTMLLSMPGN